LKLWHRGRTDDFHLVGNFMQHTATNCFLKNMFSGPTSERGSISSLKRLPLNFVANLRSFGVLLEMFFVCWRWVWRVQVCFARDIPMSWEHATITRHFVGFPGGFWSLKLGVMPMAPRDFNCNILLLNM